MMNDGNETKPVDDALDWAIRIEDPEFDDWDAHFAWLEESPGNPELYRRAALALSDGLADLAALPSQQDVRDDAPRAVPVRWGLRAGWLAGAVAVAASVAIVVAPRPAPIDRQIVYETDAGRSRRVSLADGTVVTMNGGSSIRSSSADPRRLVLDRGEVFVDVVHDERSPFRLSAAGSVFQDVGTAFNVRVDGREVSLAVSEGVVAYDPERADIRLTAGRSISIGARDVTLGRVDARQVGSWRAGRLVYDDAPLARVAKDLSMSLGVRIRMAEAARARRFSGVIVLDGDRSAVMRRFVSLAGLTGRREGAAWRIEDAP